MDSHVNARNRGTMIDPSAVLGAVVVVEMGTALLEVAEEAVVIGELQIQHLLPLAGEEVSFSLL